MFDAFERPTKRAERIVNMKFVETSAETLEAASRKFPADDVAIVEYPSFNALRKVVENPQYAAMAAPHRRAALENWLLIACTKMEMPG